MKEDILDTQFEDDNKLEPVVKSLIGKMVMGRDMMTYEVLDLYPSVEAFKKSKNSRSGVHEETGIQWSSWQLLEQKDKFHPVTIQRGEIWTIIDVYVEGENLVLMKIAGRGGLESGWTEHFFRLRIVDG